MGMEDPVSHMTGLLDSGHLGKLFKLTLEHFKDTVSDDDLTQFVDVYRRHDPDIDLHDDAEALDVAKSYGPIGLITDGTHALQRNRSPHWNRSRFTPSSTQARSANVANSTNHTRAPLRSWRKH